METKPPDTQRLKWLQYIGERFKEILSLVFTGNSRSVENLGEVEVSTGVLQNYPYVDPETGNWSKKAYYRYTVAMKTRDGLFPENFNLLYVVVILPYPAGAVYPYGSEVYEACEEHERNYATNPAGTSVIREVALCVSSSKRGSSVAVIPEYETVIAYVGRDWWAPVWPYDGMLECLSAPHEGRFNFHFLEDHLVSNLANTGLLIRFSLPTGKSLPSRTFIPMRKPKPRRWCSERYHSSEAGTLLVRTS